MQQVVRSFSGVFRIPLWEVTPEASHGRRTPPGDCEVHEIRDVFSSLREVNHVRERAIRV